jgi:hypothetical protein
LPPTTVVSRRDFSPSNISRRIAVLMLRKPRGAIQMLRITSLSALYLLTLALLFAEYAIR